MSDKTQTTPESVQEGTSGGLNARNGLPALARPTSGVPAARTFQPDDRVRVAEDATYSDGSGDWPTSAAGLTRFINGGPDRHGDYQLDGGAWAHESFLTLITPDPDPQEAPMPEFIDIDTTPDLPVIAYEDIKPGMVVEKRERFAIRADGLWEGYLPTFRLVSAPEPDPDAELAEQVEAALSLGHPVDPQSIRDVIALVDEHRAGGSDE